MSYFDNSSRFMADPTSSPGPKTSFNIKPSFPCLSGVVQIKDSTIDNEDLRRRRLASKARAASKSRVVGLYETHFSDAFNATAILQATTGDNRSDIDSKITILPGPSHYDVAAYKTLAAEAGTKGSSFSPHSPTECRLRIKEDTDHLGPGCYSPPVATSLIRKSHNKSPPSKATLYINSPKHSPRQGTADELPTQCSSRSRINNATSYSSGSKARSPRNSSSESTGSFSTKPKSTKELKEAFILVKDLHKQYQTNVESSDEYLYRELFDSITQVDDGFLNSC